MYNELGKSFLPRGGASETSGPGGNRLEDVLRVFSFRLPRILGARPVAPAELLNAHGGNGDPFASAIVNSVLSNVLKGSPSTMNAAAAPDPGAASPLSQLMAPMLGPGVGGTEALRTPTPKIHAIPSPEPPVITPVEDGPGSGNFGGDFDGEFTNILGQLTRRRRMV